MFSKRKIFLFLAMLYGILLSYLLCQFLLPNSPLARLSSIFQSVHVTFIFLAFSLLLITFVLSELTYFLYGKLRRMRWFRPKLGEILVSEGYLTEKEVKEALSEQSLRIGEVLVQGGRITTEQLSQALAWQSKESRNLGEILKELGLATEKDINWALDRMERKLGRILREKSYITDHEVRRILIQQRHGPR
jgi:hypothetical protein